MQGAQVTVIGMILVFLTLLIAAVVIMVLDRIFRPKVKEAKETAPAILSIAKLVSAPPTATVPQDDLKAKAAAIAVAIALQARRRKSLQLPLQRLTKGEEALQDIPGEPITVLTIDPGSATWSSYGRMKAMQ